MFGIKHYEVGLLIFSTLALVWPCSGQGLSQHPLPSPLIDPTKPSVYLTYKESETVTSKWGETPTEVIWLELKNNTRWGIGNWGSPDGFGGSGWCYHVVTDDPCRNRLSPPMGNCGDTKGPMEVASNKSVLIAVSPYHLSRGLAIETNFFFDWETTGGVRHSLGFGYSDLPAQARRTYTVMEETPRPCCGCGSGFKGPEPPTLLMLPSLPQILDRFLPTVTPPSPPKDASTNPKKK